MRTLILVVFSLPCAWGQSIDCANNVTAESDRKVGPGGVFATLVVHSEDDHAKDSHDCMATYTLRIVLPDGRNSAEVLIPPMGFISSDAEWGRRISVRLDGFSVDGQHIFGVISEGGKSSSVTVFDFNRDGTHSEIPVRNGLSSLKAAKCGTSFAVAGTAETGQPVLEPNTDNSCRTAYRWLLDKTGRLRAMPKSSSVVRLYTSRPQ